MVHGTLTQSEISSRPHFQPYLHQWICHGVLVLVLVLKLVPKVAVCDTFLLHLLALFCLLCSALHRSCMG